jgi:hypothetical protein
VSSRDGLFRAGLYRVLNDSAHNEHRDDNRPEPDVDERTRLVSVPRSFLPT